jgi:hypothetical protein
MYDACVRARGGLETSCVEPPERATRAATPHPAGRHVHRRFGHSYDVNMQMQID